MKQTGRRNLSFAILATWNLFRENAAQGIRL